MAEFTNIKINDVKYDVRDASAARASDLAAKQDVISDLSAIRSGATAGATALQSHQPLKTINGQSLVGSGNITVVGEKGDKGDTGSVTVTDGVAQITIVNDLTTGGTGDALSAAMGKMLRKAIAGLLSELSPTAFTGPKPTESDLGIYAPKFTITLPTDTSVDMTNQGTQVEAGDSYTNTFSLNETAEEGYVLRLSATMEGGGEISADSTTGVVSTNNVTGNITITASAGVPPMKVHSWGYEPSTDGDGKHYLADSVGDFWLYSKADAGLGVAFPNNYYGNIRSGKDETGATGYGSHRTLDALVAGEDFTLCIKHLGIVLSGNNAYNASQKAIRLFKAVNIKYKVGQFEIGYNSNNGSSATSANMSILLHYGTGTEERQVIFDDVKTPIKTQDNYDYYLVFVSSTKTATVYRVKNDGSSVDVCGEKVVEEDLCSDLIAYLPSEDYMQGLDVYNYAMSQADIENEYSND